jgi:hypothetical protein
VFKFLVHRGLWIKGLGISEKCLRVNGLGVRGFRDFMLRDY